MCIFRCLVANQCLCLWYYSTCFLFKMVQDFLVPTIPKSGLAAFRCCLHPAIQPLRRGFVVGPHCYPTTSKWCRVLCLANPFSVFFAFVFHTFCLMTIFLSWWIILCVCFNCSCSKFSTEHLQTSKDGLKSFGLLGHFGPGLLLNSRINWDGFLKQVAWIFPGRANTPFLPCQGIHHLGMVKSCMSPLAIRSLMLRTPHKSGVEPREILFQQRIANLTCLQAVFQGCPGFHVLGESGCIWGASI